MEEIAVQTTTNHKSFRFTRSYDETIPQAWRIKNDILQTLYAIFGKRCAVCKDQAIVHLTVAAHGLYLCQPHLECLFRHDHSRTSDEFWAKIGAQPVEGQVQTWPADPRWNDLRRVQFPIHPDYHTPYTVAS